MYINTNYLYDIYWNVVNMMVWLKMIALFVTLLLLQYSMKVETAELGERTEVYRILIVILTL